MTPGRGLRRLAAVVAGVVLVAVGGALAWRRASSGGGPPAVVGTPWANPAGPAVVAVETGVVAPEIATPIAKAHRGIFYGWWVLAAMTLLLTVGSALAWGSFTFYITPMEEDFGWNRTQTSIAAVITMVAFAISAPITGWWIDHKGARSGIIIGVLGTTAGLALLRFTNSLWEFYAYWAIVAFFRTSIAWIPAVILASRWFRRKRGLALGIVTSGAPIGTILVLPYLAAVIDRVGWEAGYAVSAIVLPAVFLPVALFVIRERPEDYGWLPDGDVVPPLADGSAGHQPERSFTAKEAMLTASFWILTAAFLLGVMGSDSFMPHQVPFFQSRGLSVDAAARILAIAAVSQLVFRAAFMFVVDRWSARLMSGLASALLALGIAAVMVSTNTAGLVVFMLAYGAGLAILPMTQTLLLSRYFGTAAMGRLTGVMELLNVGGVFIGPILGGVIFDRTGSYAPALAFYAASIGLSALLYLMAWPPKRRERPVGEAPVPVAVVAT